jgi:hypothetical protein
MHRALIKILVGLAVALGLTLTSAPVAHAAPGTVGPSSSAAASSCASEQAALAKAKENRGRAVRALKHARNDLRKAKRAEAKATTRKAKAAKHKDVVRAKSRVKAKQMKVRKTKRKVSTRTQRTSTACRPTGTPSRPTKASPIQALCDGAPEAQPLCDALLSLLPDGADPLTATFAQLCAAAPEAKPICDLLDGQVPDATALQDLLVEIGSQLDPALLESLLGSLLEQLGVADVIGLEQLTSILDNVLAELAAIVDLVELGDLGDVLADILDLLGL